MELLIVISIILILMLVAIPTAGKIRKHANELSAQKSLQTIEQAESMYESTYPDQRLRLHPEALGGEPSCRPAQRRPPPASSTASWPPASSRATSSTSPTAPR